MTQFTVETSELKQLALTALMLANSLDEGNLPRGAINGIAGHPRVDDAYSEFVTHWIDGLAKAQKHLLDLEGRLASAAHQYEDAEKALTRSHQNAASQLRGDGGSR